MAVDKFKFVSPGVFINEIDESIIPPLPERMGPLIIGRFLQGPANRPIKVDSFKEFVQIFGPPAPGVASGDIWRSGAPTSPTYAAYAVQAWLRNNAPCTVLRVLGDHHSNATANDATAESGWKTENSFTSSLADHGGAYGLVIVPNPDGYTGDTQAVGTDILELTSNAGGNETGDDCAFSVTIPTAYGGSGNAINIKFTNTGLFNTGPGTSTDIYVHDDASDVKCAQTVVNAINGSSQNDPSSDYAVKYGSGGGDNASTTTDGIIGITAALTSTDAVTVTAATAGVGGNTITWANTADNVVQTAVSMAGGSGPAVTGTLAAVWYVNDGAIVLSGTNRAGTAEQGAATWIKSNSGLSFKALVTASSGITKTATFNFDRDSDKFIRKVFNTDPTATNGQVFSSIQTHWLGETFESNVLSAENSQLAITGAVATGTSNFLGAVFALEGPNSNITWGDRLGLAARASATGWIFSQDNRGDTYSNFDPTAHTDNLFKIHALGGAGTSTNGDPGAGEWSNREIKVSIQDIKAPSDNFNKFGTFTVLVRKMQDTDNKPIVLERFTGCNLNPNSADYIGRKIGDKNYGYDEANKSIREHGDNENRSAYIRVELSDLVTNGNAEGKLPFGSYGPVVPKTFEIISGSDHTNSTYLLGSGAAAETVPWPTLNDGHGSDHMVYTTAAITASVQFPAARLRISSSEGDLVKGNKAFFGFQSNMKGSRRFDATNLDLLRGMPQDVDPHTSPAAYTQYSWVFTLDDVKESPTNSNHAVYLSGSRASNDSYTAKSGSFFILTGSGAGYNRFTIPMFGGFDGFDITEPDPFRNTYLAEGTSETNSSFYSLKKAIDIAADPDFLEYDLLAMPGITNRTLNTQMINVCEDRADALAVIDLAGNYKPKHENTDSESSRIGSVTDVVSEMKNMSINSSYACTFYPFVKIRDTLSDAVVYVPPSVVALGTFSSSQRKSAVWFAPAGFTRGGLSEGSAGLPVVGVRQRLTSDERDDLYESNINPIASFPAEGIVIFGQKTMQVTQSALDRINVRRLLIYLKKEISRIASRLLFEQNVQATWERFTGKAIPFLEGVKAGLGITDFKIVLDETTTTPDLVDRNVMYAKIFLKPARSIEFIALDFIITRSGASFDD